MALASTVTARPLSLLRAKTNLVIHAPSLPVPIRISQHSQDSSAKQEAPCPRQRLAVSCQATASSSDSHEGHAFLHDFCMGIPYAAIAVLSGIALVVLGLGRVGWRVTIAGVIVALASFLSLRTWKAGEHTSTFTLVAAGASGYTAGVTYTSLPSLAGVPFYVGAAILALSTALTLFSLYNVLAGGNPPKKIVTTADAA